MSRPASSPLEVDEVDNLPRDRRLRGCHVRAIEPEGEQDARELVLRGWVLGEEEPVLGVEFLHGEHVVGREPVSLPRADIADTHPDLAHASASGFEHRLNLLATQGEVELEVRAILDPTMRLPIARLTARRPPVDAAERVTVVIPCYGQAHFLGEAIASVLGQTHPEVAILVVDDGSPDNTAEVAARYPGVRCLRQENQGLAAARNAGLERVETEFVLFLDADDRLLPKAIETGLAQLRRAPHAVMAAGGWQLIGEEGEPLPAELPEPPREAYPALLESCFISTPAAVLYRRVLFAEVGGFDPDVSASADYDLYLRAAARYPVRLHREVVAEYRRHGANMTRDPELIMRSEIAVLRRQAPVVANRPELREALGRGIQRSRAYHGERMR